MRLTHSSSSNSRAMESFSRALNETPDVCSPSRSVVSIISTGGSIVAGYFRASSNRRIWSEMLHR